MDRWLYGYDLFKRWRASEADLKSFILHGLTPHDPATLEPCSFQSGSDFVKTETRVKHTILSDRLPHRFSPEIEEITITVLVERFVFKLSDVEAFEKKHGLGTSSPIPDRAGKSSTNLRQQALNSYRAECRAKATERWKKDPSMTKRDMAEWLLGQFRDGYTYGGREPLTVTLSTMGLWIKDLNPNSRPGRRVSGK